MQTNNTDMEELNEQFCIACQNGNLEEAQQLLRENPDINISVYYECAFRLACAYGHLVVSQWLLQVKPDIDILVDNEYAFRYACANGRLEVAKWLAEEVKPARYEITEVTRYDEGNYGIQYKIYENNDRPMDYILK